MGAPDKDYVSQCKLVADKIFRLVQMKSKYDADRCRIVGGLAKKTSTFVKIDADLVIFVNVVPGNVLSTKKKVLEDWFDILLMNTDLKEEDIRKSPFSLQFFYKNVEIDLLVAINFDSDPSIQQRLAMKHIKTSPDPRKTSDQMSSELTELAVHFMKNKSKFCHDLARLAKFWSQTILYPEYVSGKSTMMEMIGVRAAMVEESRKPGQPSYQAAFNAFLEMVADMSSIKLIFYDHYQKTDVPSQISSQVPLLLDPTNPYNNLFSREVVVSGDNNNNPGKGSKFLDLFSDCAKHTIEILTMGLPQTHNLFLPQPMMWNNPMIKAVVPHTYYISVEDYHDPMPRDKGRVGFPPQVQRIVEIMMWGYTCAIKAAEAEKPNSTAEELKQKVIDTVDKMENRKLEWIIRQDRHDTRDTTMMMPLMGGNKGKAVFLSFNITVHVSV